MKLSPKKKGQIYDLVHIMIRERRREIQENYLPTTLSDDLRNKVDYQIAQLEVPLAQAIMKLLQGKSKEQL
jgi:hypothetical protein